MTLYYYYGVMMLFHVQGICSRLKVVASQVLAKVKYIPMVLGVLGMLAMVFPFSSIFYWCFPPAYGFAQGQSSSYFEGKSHFQRFDLLAQSEHCNLWYDGKDFGDYSFSSQDVQEAGGIFYTDDYALALIQEIDAVYEIMTQFIPHKGQVHQNSLNLTLLTGDVDRDGRINVFLSHDEDSHFLPKLFRSTWTSPAIDGFFISEQVAQPSIFGENVVVNTKFSGIVAHEMQHLFYSMYISNENINDSLWFNEMLSGAADLFYSKEGEMNFSRNLWATLDFLEHSDFFRFDNSEQSYERSYSLAYFFQTQMNEQFLEDIYGFFRESMTESSLLGHSVYTGTGVSLSQDIIFQAITESCKVFWDGQSDEERMELVYHHYVRFLVYSPIETGISFLPSEEVTTISAETRYTMWAPFSRYPTQTRLFQLEHEGYEGNLSVTVTGENVKAYLICESVYSNVVNVNEVEVFELTLGEEFSTQIAPQNVPEEGQYFYVVVSGFQTSGSGSVGYAWEGVY